MSATAKTITALIVATLTGTVANAQEMSSDFFTNLTTQEEVSSVKKNEVLSQIDKMMSEVTAISNTEAAPAVVTIDQIDRQNREALRLTSQAEIRDLKFQEIEAQLNMMILLETARTKLADVEVEAASKAAAIDVKNPESKLFEPPAEDIEKKMQADLAALEESAVPRISNISGSGGQYSAVAVSKTGVEQEVTVGSILVNGFRVEDIDINGVIVSGDRTGKQYFIAPSSQAAPTQSAPSYNDAIDMGSDGFPGVF